MLDEIAYDNIDEKTDWLYCVFDNLEVTRRKLYWMDLLYVCHDRQESRW